MIRNLTGTAVHHEGQTLNPEGRVTANTSFLYRKPAPAGQTGEAVHGYNGTLDVTGFDPATLRDGDTILVNQKVCPTGIVAGWAANYMTTFEVVGK